MKTKHSGSFKTEEPPKKKKRIDADPDGKPELDHDPVLVCCICDDDSTCSEFPAHKLSAKCKHEPDCCAHCFGMVLDHNFLQNSRLPLLDVVDDDRLGQPGLVSCPTCGVDLSMDEVKAAAPAESFKRWSRIWIRRQQEREPDFRWCLSPSCLEGQKVIPAGRKKIWTCSSCDFKNCIVCERPWHKGETCRAYQLRVNLDKSHEFEASLISDTLLQGSNENEISDTDDELGNAANDDIDADSLQTETDAIDDGPGDNSTIKICPGPNCGRRICKEDGCWHMICTICGTGFCWYCLTLHADEGSDTEHRDWCQIL